LKILYYLRLAGLPFESVTGLGNLRRSPKGKLPFIRDGETVIADSAFIVEYLKDTYGDRLGADYTAEQLAVGRSVARMLEESTYWALVHSRWIDPENWELFTRPEFFGALPWPLKSLVPALVQRGLKRSMKGQGMGRHTPEEIYQIGQRDLAALAGVLGNKPFLLGPLPGEHDATVHAFLVCAARAPHPSPMRDYILANLNLVAYMQRMDQRLATPPPGSAAQGAGASPGMG
jgi:glutathione S-transferase